MSWPENHDIHNDRRFDSATSLLLAALPQLLGTSSTASEESSTYGSSKSGPWAPFDRDKHQWETPDVITCVQCTKPFRGRFQHGNLARHIKHSHGAVELQYPCFVSGCNKSYKRTDARLKHIRKQHPESHSASISDHKEVDDVEIVAVGSHFDEPEHLHSSNKAKCAAHQGSPPTQPYALSSTEAMSELHIARMVLTALYNDLGDEYPAYVAHYLSSWSSKVEQMRLDRARDYAAYPMLRIIEPMSASRPLHTGKTAWQQAQVQAAAYPKAKYQRAKAAPYATRARAPVRLRSPSRTMPGMRKHTPLDAHATSDGFSDAI
ncbi:hypothetical protein LEMA_P084920.1 [Plenodomus lingam JN3]|uniref:C2H2-type domain-containing protein n=1 Tax=Leptosphaeria maculans (strain JN3 / isolate v23.1.3 / race Av1-4-5-6-7-8) TaxID=985895 RepID=E5A6K8_LEPMJ|nr:hypothetical protein LEMA_P084920.1 [Plenodomus lingam JN3]CBX99253.1 hypothetical protein LEMA_P084920.1 [Plenodomus lingam JN3]